ncbi:alpha/beta hydrolase [Nakamurella flava]|nr:alpha/beta hydrolase [Nakamurella flava]
MGRSDRTTGRVFGRVGRGAAVAVGLALVPVSTFAAVLLTPRPTVALIRFAFTKGAARTRAAMQAGIDGPLFADPETGRRQAVPTVTDHLDVAYGPDRDERLDVFEPATTGPSTGRPVLVWVHGGGWVSGDKSDVAPYLRALAAVTGAVCVGVNYSVPPRRSYPTAIRQLTDALAFLRREADRWELDATRVVLAGDSAGAQLAGQLTEVVTTPGLADDIGVPVPLPAEHLRAIVLCCGLFVLPHGMPAPAVVRFAGDQVSRAYLAGPVRPDDPRIEQLDVAARATDAFPPTFVTAGNADPLLPSSRALVDRLHELGVPVQTRFFPDDHTPRLPHEYQFHLDLADARTCFADIAAFVGRHTAD